MSSRFVLAPRWAARMAVTAGTGAITVLLLFAGLDSLLLVLVGAAGLAVTAAGVWWALVHTGLVRVLAAVLAFAAPAVVVVLYVVAGLLWVVLVSLALWVLAVFCGRVALAGAEAAPAEPREPPAVPPRRPYLIMNPRSGGGKVGRFRLREKAEALGAEVLVLDVTHQQDVAALARRAADAGADLLGVAGGDGTQALVAAVAAERDLPFMVISAGTRNHFALDLGLDRDDPSTCLDALTDGVELRIDLGFINDRVFVNNASFGAYAAVVQSPAYRDDKVHTTLQMLPDLLTHQYGPRLVVRAGGGATVEQPQAVLVSNNPYRTDDPAGLGRRDRLNSGHLGVLGVKVDSAAQAAGMLRGHRAPGLAQFTAQEVVVDADEDAIPVGVDGEALTLSTPVRCRIEPRALRVRVPRERPGVRPGRPPMDWHRVRRLALTTFRRPRDMADDRAGPGPGVTLSVVARSIGVSAGLVVAYYLVSLDEPLDVGTVAGLVLGLTAVSLLTNGREHLGRDPREPDSGVVRLRGVGGSRGDRRKVTQGRAGHRTARSRRRTGSRRGCPTVVPGRPWQG